ncbi:hypothetical protein M408DRAFT_300474 [Serendipita vermifera MAFF 305830]|uniref:F-box domain-containing protein n=1 Tax=Serendipita vermifera MAFF 305830 TaxID=933852 RepID=A0A0C2WWQ4_SERVB|nr:hypothetical protein M408DRAFT_300474 [Serendipita vermifera MAFF 305830]
MGNSGMDVLSSISCPSIEVLQAIILSKDCSTLQSNLQTFSNLKDLELTIIGSYPGSRIPDTPTVSKISRITLSRLVVTFKAASGPNLTTLSLLTLFCSTRNVKLSHEQENFDWPSAISIFAETVEELALEQQILATKSHVRVKSELSHSRLSYPRLKSLKIDRLACSPILSSIVAPALRKLSLTAINGFTPSAFLAFIQGSPDIRILRLTGIYMAITPPFSTTFPPLPTAIEEIDTTHHGLPILNFLTLKSLHTLRLLGVFQSKSGKQVHAYSEPSELHLSPICKLDLTILRALTTLDLCVGNLVLQLVIGLAEALPLLIRLEVLSLPRTHHNTNILVDILVENMRQGGTWAGDKAVLPRLKRLHTKDYPEWESLLMLLAERNRTAHIKGEKKGNETVPLEELNLPGLPNSFILERVQLAMAGKFPSRNGPQITTTVGCDDCKLTRSVCEDPNVERTFEARSSCGRHTLGTVHITANSSGYISTSSHQTMSD